MPNPSFHRLYCLLQQLELESYPDFKKLQRSLLSNDIEISPRTLQRDIEQLRYQFGIEIIYNRQKRGYFIDKEMSNDTTTLLQFFSRYLMNDEIIENLFRNKSNLEYFDFEYSLNSKGKEWIEIILKAIKNRKIIIFKHFSYQTEKETAYQFCPYLIKEFQGRWYVIGKLNKQATFMSFGLDRLRDLGITKHKFEMLEWNKAKSVFKDTIGVTYDEEPEELVLKIKYPQAHYQKSLPWHHSQKIIEDKKGFCVFAYQIVLNFEVKQKILSLGSSSEILKPNWLRKEIKKEIENNLKQYL